MVSNQLASLPPGYLLLIAYWTIFIAELVGDKSIYTISSLSLRFRPAVIVAAMICAFGLKIMAAVLLGRMLVRIESHWTDLMSAAAFFISAMLIWFEEDKDEEKTTERDVRWLKAALVSFGSLMFTEWGDPGQISAAALTLKSHAIFPVWLGGTLAMTTKGVLAMVLGLKLREQLPQRMLRTLACASCCILGLIALGGGVFR